MRWSSREPDDPARRDLPVVGLDHDVVPVGEGRDLREVGDDDDLAVPGELGEPAPDLHRDPAADAGVDLVEDERAARTVGGQHDLEREPDAGQLAAGGDLAEAARLGARVGREEQVDRVGAVRAERGRGEGEGQAGVRHGQGGQLAGHGVGEPLGRAAAQGR